MKHIAFQTAFSFSDITTCNCCGRQLTNPISVERGIGPICSHKGYKGDKMINEETRPTAKAPYEIIEHKGWHNKGYCAVWTSVSGAYGKNVFVVMAEPLSYNGVSVTNAVEIVASEVVRRYNLNPGYCTFIEHYSSKLSWRSDESFAFVSFNWNNGKASSPDWRHTTRQLVEELIGREVPVV